MNVRNGAVKTASAKSQATIHAAPANLHFIPCTFGWLCGLDLFAHCDQYVPTGRLLPFSVVTTHDTPSPPPMMECFMRHRQSLLKSSAPCYDTLHINGLDRA